MPHIPVGIVGVVMTVTMLQETERVRNLSFDYKGFLLAGVGFCTALLALTRVSQDGWTSDSVLLMFGISAVALASWVYVELTEDEPLLDLRIFRNATYTQAAIIYFVSAVILFSALFLLPLFLQNIRGLSPIQTGLLLMPEAVAIAVMLPFAGRLYDKFGPVPMIIPGLLGMAYSMYLLHSLDVNTSDADLIKILVLRGVSMGMMAMPAFTLAMSVHPPQAVARASALTNVLRQMFPAFGIAFFATILQTRHAFHASSLAQTVTPDSLAAMQVISRISESAGQFGASNGVAGPAAVQVLDGLVQQQAAIRAFNDVFLVAVVISLLAVPLAIFLRKPKPQERPQPADTTTVAEPAD
jgi:EmrB/QacA subfamily drug resistance transporter